MKNIYAYYFVIIAPIIPFYFWHNYLETEWVVFAVFFYILPYRIILDTWRLLSLEAIEPNKIWITLIPFLRFKYYRALFLGIRPKDESATLS